MEINSNNTANTHSGLTVDMVPLTNRESEQLKKCEGILDRGLATFFEVGSALLTIRDNRLYRATHRTFEQYCRERWQIGRSYAWRVIGAAERMKLLSNMRGQPKPENEFQIRPFLRIASEDFPSAWEQTLKKTHGRKLTAALINEVLAEFRSDNNSLKRAPRSARSKLSARLSLGQMLTLLHETKSAVEKSEKDHALEVLERIETLLFCP